MQNPLETPADLSGPLMSVLQLERDTLQAYDEAIKRLSRPKFTLALNAFAHHHARHIAELDLLFRSLSIEPEAPDSSAIRARGRVLLGAVLGDRGTLRAMKHNEDDTNAAYQRLVSHAGLPAHVRAHLQEYLDEERRHRAWIEEVLDGTGGGFRPQETFTVSFANFVSR